MKRVPSLDAENMKQVGEEKSQSPKCSSLQKQLEWVLLHAGLPSSRPERRLRARQADLLCPPLGFADSAA